MPLGLASTEGLGLRFTLGEGRVLLACLKRPRLGAEDAFDFKRLPICDDVQASAAIAVAAIEMNPFAIAKLGPVTFCLMATLDAYNPLSIPVD